VLLSVTKDKTGEAAMTREKEKVGKKSPLHGANLLRAQCRGENAKETREKRGFLKN